MAHPSLPPGLVEAVRAAFIGMDQDPEGHRALQASADALGSRELWGFVRADDTEYENYRRFYRTTMVKGD